MIASAIPQSVLLLHPQVYSKLASLICSYNHDPHGHYGCIQVCYIIRAECVGLCHSLSSSVSPLFSGSDGQSASHARHLQDLPSSQFLKRAWLSISHISLANQRPVFSDFLEIYLIWICFPVFSLIYYFHLDLGINRFSLATLCLLQHCKSEVKALIKMKYLVSELT